MKEVLPTSPAPENARPVLTDAHGRSVRYIRLSITDRCNLRCSYCWGCSSMKFLRHEDILRYEEMLDLIDVAVDLGVEKVRLTGGEPLTRKGFIPFLEILRKRHPALDLRLTTNGTLLAPHVPALKALGIRAVNISLDSFSPEKTRAICGRDLLAQTMEGIHAVLEAGMILKLNAVALRGVNDSELPLFLDFAKKSGAEVRFIEFMPMGAGTAWTSLQYWSATDILAAARQYAELTPIPRNDHQHGPAQLYSIDGGPGRFGLITPLSNHFCDDCNRLRITADGRLRTCLFSDREYKLRPLLRHPKLGLPAVRRVFERANRKKPLGYRLLARERAEAAVADRRMSSIGG